MIVEVIVGAATMLVGVVVGSIFMFVGLNRKTEEIRASEVLEQVVGVLYNSSVTSKEHEVVVHNHTSYLTESELDGVVEKPSGFVQMTTDEKQTVKDKLNAAMTILADNFKGDISSDDADKVDDILHEIADLIDHDEEKKETVSNV